MRKIQLIKVSTSKGVNGNWSGKSEEIYPVWAWIVMGSGGRNYTNGQTKLTTGYTFKVRFRDDFDISGDWRVLYLGKRFTVTSIERDKEKRFYWNIKADGEDNGKY